MKDLVKNYLKEEPRARERLHKDRALVNLLIKRFPAMKWIEKGTLIRFVKDYSSMDRAWRQILEEHEELRGVDYNQKEIVSQKKQLELGYLPGYDNDIKKRI